MGPEYNYLADYRIVNKAISLGYVVTKVHKVIETRQAHTYKYMADTVSAARKQYTLNGEIAKANTCKNMGNSPYGKTLEDVTKRTNHKLINVRTEADLLEKETHIGNPYFSRIIDYDNGLYGIDIANEVVELNKPRFIGAAILDLAKLLNVEFVYDVLSKLYPKEGQIELCATDTDGMILKINTEEDHYDNMKKFAHKFDLSEMRFDWLKDNTNQKALGSYKDETGGNPIIEFAGTAAKSYAFKVDQPVKGKTETLRAKGVSRVVVKYEMNIETYKDVLYKREGTFRTVTSITSQKHIPITKTTVKKALGPFDDKFYLMPDGITGVPYGHYSLNHQIIC